MKRLWVIIPLFYALTLTAAVDREYTPDWSSYELKIEALLKKDSYIKVSRRMELRMSAKEELLKRASLALENSEIDSEHSLKDYLATNSSFARKYALFLEDLELGGVFFSHRGIDARLSIPLRGRKGLLRILPLPWQQNNYAILQPEDYMGAAYEQTEARGEYRKSYAPAVYTGLIIDVRDHHFTPSLAPRVYSADGRLLYGPEYLNRYAGIRRGVAGFGTSLNDRHLKNRAGSSPMLSHALSIKGRNLTDAVISEEDSRRILAHRKSVKNLKKARVVFLISKN